MIDFTKYTAVITNTGLGDCEVTADDIAVYLDEDENTVLLNTSYDYVSAEDEVASTDEFSIFYKEQSEDYYLPYILLEEKRGFT